MCLINSKPIRRTKIRGIAPFILNLNTRCVIRFTPLPLYLHGNDLHGHHTGVWSFFYVMSNLVVGIMKQLTRSLLKHILVTRHSVRRAHESSSAHFDMPTTPNDIIKSNFITHTNEEVIIMNRDHVNINHTMTRVKVS